MKLATMEGGRFVFNIQIINLFISILLMIDKALSSLGNNQDPFYFQIYPLHLSIVKRQSQVPAPGTTYRFTILKGSQKFDESKFPIEANYRRVGGVNVMIIPKCPLNFYIPTFTKNRKTEFTLSMHQTEGGQEYFIGNYDIDIEPYITEFKNDKTVRFQLKTMFSDDYELEFEIYIQKTRFNLEKAVKEFKVQRGQKSPLKQRRQSSVSSSSKTRSIVRGNDTPLKQDFGQKQTQNSPSRMKFTGTSTGSNFKDSQKGQLKQTQSQIAPEVESNVKKSMRESMSKSSAAKSLIVQTEQVKVQKKQASEVVSQSSVTKKKVPALQIKYKASKKAEPEESQQKIDAKPAPSEDWKEKAFLWGFLFVSLAVIYMVMHPNRKV